MKMEEILVKMEKIEKMEKIHVILKKITVTIPSFIYCIFHYYINMN